MLLRLSCAQLGEKLSCFGHHVGRRQLVYPLDVSPTLLELCCTASARTNNDVIVKRDDGGGAGMRHLRDVEDELLAHDGVELCRLLRFAQRHKLLRRHLHHGLRANSFLSSHVKQRRLVETNLVDLGRGQHL
jgi:hypothetical protein